MEQKDFDIYEILKGVPDGTSLYTRLCGNVEFTCLASNKEAWEAIWTENKNGEYSFNKNGRWMEGGEVMLFPSKEMKDWSKFFKKGDVLEFVGDEKVQGTCTFEKFEDETKKFFIGKYVKEKEALYSKRPSRLRTADWVKSDDPAAYIRFVEERLGGKLNLETLEIEKLVFETGHLYVFREEDEDGELTIIGKLIGKNESEDTLTFGTQYEIETEKFVTDQTFYLNISLHKELRKATEDETFLFKEAYAQWQEKEKKAKSKCSFKPFDKVLVRGGSGNWLPAFFVRDRGEGYGARINALPIHSGYAGDFTSCIPFEGNEHLAFTEEDFKDLPF